MKTEQQATVKGGIDHRAPQGVQQEWNLVVTLINIEHFITSIISLQHGMELMFLVKKNSPDECEQRLILYKNE